MGYLEGILSGYMDRHREIETENLLRSHEAMQREGKVYEALLNSSDPQVQAMAAAGMLQMGQPRKRKGGLAGWMGEVESTPGYPRLMNYFQSLPADQQQEALTPRASGITTTGGAIPTPTPASSPGSAALPTTQTTVAGQPGPTPVEPSPAGKVTAEPGPVAQGPEFEPVTAPTSGYGPSVGPQVSTPAPPGAARFFQHQPVGVRAMLQPQAQGPTPQAAPAQAPAQAPDQGPPAPPEGIQGPVGQEMAMPQPPAGPPIQPPPGPPKPSLIPPAAEGPNTSLSAGPPTTTSQKLAAPPPRPPHISTQANFFPTVYDLAVQKNQADVAGDITAYQEAFRQTGDPDYMTSGLHAYMAQKMRGSGIGQSYAEGNIIPDSTSPTGFSQELYLRNDPNQRVLIPAQPPNTPEYMAKKAEAATTARMGAASTGPLSTQQRTTLQNQLHTDWQKVQSPLREMARQFNLMETGLQRFHEGERVASVEAIRVTLEKILDPNSVVREGEYSRQGFGLSLADRLQGLWQKYAEGGGEIPEPALADMVETARQFLAGMQGWNDNERQRITNIATDKGIDPAFIFGGPVGPTQAPPPPPGTSQAQPPQSPGTAQGAPKTYTPPPGAPKFVQKNGKWVQVPQ